MASCTKEGCCLSPTSAQPGRRADCGSKRRTHRDLANGTAALFVSALGFGTTALMLRSAWLLHWLNHGHQLTAIAAFSYEANASSNAAVYLFMLRWSADGQGDICRVSVLLACGARVTRLLWLVVSPWSCGNPVRAKT